MTSIVNIKRESCDLYIGRPSEWGNPFLIGRDGTREEVIKKYEEWIRKDAWLMSKLNELIGLKLGCFCKPKECHGDVLIKLIKEAGLE